MSVDSMLSIDLEILSDRVGRLVPLLHLMVKIEVSVALAASPSCPKWVLVGLGSLGVRVQLFLPLVFVVFCFLFTFAIYLQSSFFFFAFYRRSQKRWNFISTTLYWLLCRTHMAATKSKVICENHCLRECNTVKPDNNSSAFRTKVPTPSSGSKSKLRKLFPSCSCLLGYYFDPEKGSIIFLRNLGEFLPDYTASYPRK
jgi:hypothetical protein